MQVFDTSSMIHAWDNYPIAQFPSMWRWMTQQLDAGHIRMPSVAVTEVGHMEPDCHAWLQGSGHQPIAMSNQILAEALHIKNMLGIVGDRYGGGVDESDLFIIASALCNGVRLVSNESVQAALPKLMHNYRIPAVCSMQGVQVECVNFVQFIKASRTVF